MVLTQIQISTQLNADINDYCNATGVPKMRFIRRTVQEFLSIVTPENVSKDLTPLSYQRGATHYTAQIRLSMIEEEHDKLKMIATAAGVPIAVLVRAILSDRLRSHDCEVIA